MFRPLGRGKIPLAVRDVESVFLPPRPPRASTEKDPLTSIVIIPGVDTLPPEQWTDRSGTSWVEALTVEVAPRAQIWIYDFTPERTELQIARQLFGEAPKFLDCLIDLLSRVGEAEPRPLLFICHSLGGIILKRALCIAKREYAQGVLAVVSGIIFLSTPHFVPDSTQNSSVFSSILRTNLRGPASWTFSEDDIGDIFSISQEFEEVVNRVPVPILSAYEGIESRTLENRFLMFRKKKCAKIVTKEICAINAGRGHFEEFVEANASHFDICKVEVSSALYSAARGILTKVVHNGSKLVAERFQTYVVPHILLQETLRSGSTATRTPRIGCVPLQKVITLPCFSAHSHTRSDKFFGQQHILRMIDDHLLPNSRLNRPSKFAALRFFALWGLGGIGKTEVAVEYIFSRQARFDAIFWLHAEDETILAQEFANIAIQLGLADASSQNKNLTENSRLAQEWLSNPVRNSDANSGQTTGNKASWLIVLDNVVNTVDLSRFWPTYDLGSVLVTSRHPMSKAMFLTEGRGHDMQTMTREDTLKFLQFLTRTIPNSRRSASLNAISGKLGGLPLAIRQTADMIIEKDLSDEDIFKLFDQEGVEHLHKLRPAKNGYTGSLATLWALERLAPKTFALLQVLSLFDPEGTQEDILLSGARDVLLENYPKTLADYYNATAELWRTSLIKRNTSKRTLQVHRLVQDAAKAKISSGLFQDVFHAAVTLLCSVWPFQTLRQRHYVVRLEKCKELFPSVLHLKNAFSDAVSSGRKFQPQDEFAKLLNDAGWYLFECGFAEQSKQYYDMANRICEKSPNKNTEELSYVLRMNLNNKQAAAAETNDRKVCLDKALDWLHLSSQRRTPSGEPFEDYEHGIAHSETGVGYGMNEMWDIAAEYFIKSVNIMKKLPDYEEEMLGWPEPNLGWIYWVQGKLDDAEIVLNNSLDIRAKAFGTDDKESFKTGKILHALGNVYWSKGLMDKSFDLHTRAYEQYLCTLGRNHHRTAAVCHRLAMHYMRMHKLKNAEKLLDDALDVFGPESCYKPELARTKFKKSQLLRLRGDEEEAAIELDKATELRSALVPDDQRPGTELTDEDFDTLVIFWSR